MKSLFPIFKIKPYGKDLVYLDSAATTQKPFTVIEAMSEFLATENANVHRGVHYLAEKTTDIYENARKTVHEFLNATREDEIIFTSGTTASINLIADTYGSSNVKPGDEIMISVMEHHSNLLPWYNLAKKTGATIKLIPINSLFEIDLEEIHNSISERTKIIAISHASNVLGGITPIKEIVKIAKNYGVCVVVDGAQYAPHRKIDVQDLDCDFYAFSGHKVYGPTGIGVLYGKKSILDKMQPRDFGGGMVLSANPENIIFNSTPHKFEAGTPNVMGAVGLMNAINFIKTIDHKLEEKIYNYGFDIISNIDGIKIYSVAKNNVGIVSFTIDDIHPHDIGTILDREGVAVRVGHHCAQPLMKHLGIVSAVRLSIGCYNTKEDIDMCVSALMKAKEMMK
jgi:cysteine desulfurase/selenocysteine lyase